MPSVDFLHKSYEINLLSGKVLIPYCHIITWCNSNVGRDQEVFVFKTLLNVIHFVCIQSRVSWKQRPQDLPPNDSELNWLGLGNWVSPVPFKSLYWANWPEIWLTQFPNPNLRGSLGSLLSRHLTVKHECTLNTIRESAKEKKCVWNGGKHVRGRGGSVCVCVGRCINMHATYSNKPKLFVSVTGIL